MTPHTAPSFALDTSREPPILSVAGDWTVHTISHVDDDLRALTRPHAPFSLDVSALGALDTAGAFVIDRTLREACKPGAAEPDMTAPELIGAHPAAETLLAQIRAASAPCATPVQSVGGMMELLERTGRGAVHAWEESVATLSFLGETIVTCMGLLLRPARLRWTAMVSVMEEAGLDALPIVAFLSFFVGMVVAFIGATTLETFALEVYTVELVGYSMLREFGVILTGIILAGRTNSSFTAQIGTMKMRQEIDAMQTLGLSPMEVLVAPRVFAMVLMTPVLAFVGTLAGIAGGMMVGWMALDIPPGMFIQRIRDSVPLDMFWVGMSKAPVFGLVVALIGCRQGLLVGGSVQSLGDHTTKSVVQALFSIIVIDAMFAIFYMEMGI